MFTRYLVLCLLVVPSLFFVSCKNEKDPLSDLHRLEGTWTVMIGESEVGETWIKESDSVMTGQGFEVTEGDTTLTESIRLVSSEAGIHYIPVVAGHNNDKPVSFKMLPGGPDKYVFENLSHDFPTRIIYEFHEKDNLRAAIEGELNGEMKSMSFDYKKKK